MPRIFDNIEDSLLKALKETINKAFKSDFCVGYFNLRGWRELADSIENWQGGDDNCCRLLVGMQGLPLDEIRAMYNVSQQDSKLDNQTVAKIKKRLAQEFREQLTIGFPTNEDESGLRILAKQLKAKKLLVKLFLRHHLHAKLYLLYRQDRDIPRTGYLGSSNLTMSGLSKQGELNIDVLDHDATDKLSKWFKDRWEDRWSIDITDELIEIINTSWASPEERLPYHIYLKIAYHLSQEARAGLAEFRIPRDFGKKLMDFQVKAVQIAAHHLNKRGGVIIGDVVGLGKTIMATALARIFEDDFGTETLIICPKNLIKMWDDYAANYRMRAKIISISQAINSLPDLRRYRTVIIDESHNLRNREGKRYSAIQEYINKNDCKVIMLTATPYNKTYLDLANQLRLFIPDDENLGVRPEHLLRQITEIDFIKKHQCSVHSLAAFEKSEYADDWRDLMRLYLVRRTRSFIKDNYAKTDETGEKYLEFEDGTRSYFPERTPKNVSFKTDDSQDQYAKLYASAIVDKINELSLSRYGLGNYIVLQPDQPPTPQESKIISDLSKAGKRLMGFSRTNLFKRLESSGWSFLLSISRHILRNYIFIYALENNLPIPIGAQYADLLDTDFYDGDVDETQNFDFAEDEDDENVNAKTEDRIVIEEKEYKKRAEEIYKTYATKYKTRFKWLNHSYFKDTLKNDLIKDAESLLDILTNNQRWLIDKDTKAGKLAELCGTKHKNEKVLIFTQFADTAEYLGKALEKLGVKKVASVTGSCDDPTSYAWRFSPISNEKKYSAEEQIRVLVATDVLSEGQNLQDCAIVVNYDLPWAIIRLIQRAGRVDRIGQKAEKILCYSFLPAEGVEKIIRLRLRIISRLKQNEEVIGTDEQFFEDKKNTSKLQDLYHEKSGILDDDEDSEVDLASYAYQIWKNAIDKNPKLEKIITELPPVVYSTKNISDKVDSPEGVIVYAKTGADNDMLTWVGKDNAIVTQSQLAILKVAECKPDTPAIPRHEKHHELVKIGIQHIVEEEKNIGGQLGSRMGARFRTYERLKEYAEQVKGTLFDTPDLHRCIDDIYRYPLRDVAKDTLNRQLRSGIDNAPLVKLVMDLREEGKLCQVSEETEKKEPKIICSMGLLNRQTAPL